MECVDKLCYLRALIGAGRGAAVPRVSCAGKVPVTGSSANSTRELLLSEMKSIQAQHSDFLEYVSETWTIRVEDGARLEIRARKK